jgi:hypothetical protein
VFSKCWASEQKMKNKKETLTDSMTRVEDELGAEK